MGRHVAPRRTPAQTLGASISRATFAALDVESLRYYVTADRVAYLVGAEPLGNVRLVTGLMGLDAAIDAAVDRVPDDVPALPAAVIDLRDAS